MQAFIRANSTTRKQANVAKAAANLSTRRMQPTKALTSTPSTKPSTPFRQQKISSMLGKRPATKLPPLGAQSPLGFMNEVELTSNKVAAQIVLKDSGIAGQTPTPAPGQAANSQPQQRAEPQKKNSDNGNSDGGKTTATTSKNLAQCK